MLKARTIHAVDNINNEVLEAKTIDVEDDQDTGKEYILGKYLTGTKPKPKQTDFQKLQSTEKNLASGVHQSERIRQQEDLIMDIENSPECAKN